MQSCSLPSGTPVATGTVSPLPNGSWGMAIYQPSSKLFFASRTAVYVCTQNNGLLTGCVAAGAPAGTFLSARDIVFLGGSALISDENQGVITCKVSASGDDLENCVNSNTISAGFGLLLI